MDPPHEFDSLDDAKAWLRSRLLNEDRSPGDGARCPCCHRWAQVYRYSISSSEARTLAEVYRRGGTETFVHVARALPQQWSHKVSQLAFRRLVEEEKTFRPDGGRAGHWRVTPRGERFLLGRVSIPKYVHIWDATPLGESGPLVTIHDAVRNRFDLREVLGEV